MNMICELAIIVVTKIFTLMLLASGRYSYSEAAMPMPTICPTTSCGSSICDSNRSYNPFINRSSHTEQMKVASDYYNDFGSQINSRTSDLLLLCSSLSSFNTSFVGYSGFVPISQVDHVREEGGSCCSTFIYNIAFGFILIPVVGILWIFWRRKQNKLVKLRRNLFVRNGGELLQTMQLQSSQKTLSIFTAEDLNKATHNYDENNVLCQENHHIGITYRGILHDVMNQTVTIKFCHGFERCNNIEFLIRKLVALSQISHRNVVKLLGCCLETQVPLVVYEFFTAQTLSDYLTDDCLARSLSWNVRLRIAADAAGALAHMHSDTSDPIIHGSLNRSSILVDHAYTHVKLHGFSLTCSECSCVQFYGGRTCGYLDPDYCLTGRLTEKSDVYNFGFILAELLTGKDVIMEGEESVAKYFLGSSRGGNLLGILDDRVVRDDHDGLQLQLQLSEVAEIAKRCLSSSSRDRPMMKEVAIALQCIIHN